MTNQSLTHLLLISDRSGSMESCRTDAEGGINAFLAEHKKAVGEANLTFVQFDTEPGSRFVSVDTVHDGSLADFDRYVLKPRGGTPLLDAIGMSVTALGEKLDKLAEDDKPGSVIVLISTDGWENASREWTKPRVKELLERQQNQWQWAVVFIGANIDAVGEATSLGIAGASSLQYDASNSSGTYAMAAANTTAYRGQRSTGVSHAEAADSLSFTKEQREAAVKPGASTSR